MAPNFEEIIRSRLLTFYVGPEATPIMVHAAAIATTSSYFDALINGGMEESQEESARLEDVCVDDFARFCEYAYCGKCSNLWWAERLDINSEQNLVITVLFELSRLYAFAHVYLIESLKMLVVKEFLCAMTMFKVCEENVKDFLDLVRYLYSDESKIPNREVPGGIDGLRRSVIGYFTEYGAEIRKHEEFISFMEEGGESVGDLWMELTLI